MTIKISQGGWVKITGWETIKAIRESGVPFDGMVRGDRTYVPRWVREAVQLYEKNPNFAEMELSEFLRRMNPVNQCKPEI